MAIFIRDFRDGELLECLETDPSHFGDGLVPRDDAIRAWQLLMRSPAFNCGVAEVDPPLGGRHIIAFGSAAFVSRRFADNEIANPRPGLTDRVIASVAKKESVVVDLAELARRNATDGVDLVTLSGYWDEALLDAEGITEIGTAMSVSFVQATRGYRLRTMMTEGIGRSQIRFLESTAVFRTIGAFRTGRENTERALMVVTRDDVDTKLGSVVAPLFHYQDPTLRLRPTDQDLLHAALRDDDDEHIATALNVRPSAIKKRWTTVFDRVWATRPDLLPRNEDGDDGSRGKRKRHRILAYVRDHPEELRPYDWSAAARTGG